MASHDSAGEGPGRRPENPEPLSSETPSAKDSTPRDGGAAGTKFRATLNAALRPLRDPDAMKSTAARLLGEHIGVEYALYVEVDGDNWMVGGSFSRDLPLAPGAYPMAQFGGWFLDHFREGRPAIVADVQTDARFSPQQRASWEATQVRSSMAVPLVKQGHLVAILTVIAARPRDWTDGDRALIEHTAERTWEAVQRAQAEAALRDTEQKYRMLFNALDDAFCIVEMVVDERDEAVDIRYIETNDGFERQTGRRPRRGDTMRQLFPGIEEMWLELGIQVVRTGAPLRMVAPVAALGRWFDILAFPTPAPRERMQLAALFRDVSASKHAEEALRQSQEQQRVALDALRDSEERLRTVIESIKDYAIFTLDTDGRITSWNDGARRLTGYEAHEVVGRPATMFCTPEEANADGAPFDMQQAIAVGRAEQEGWRLRRDGSRFWANEILTPLRNAGGTLVGFTRISRDLTERKAFETALQGAHDSLEARVQARTAEVQALFERLVSVQEEERRRIARDIHDHLGQQMTALRMTIEVLRSSAAAVPALAAHAARTQRLAADLDHSIDVLTWELRPAVLDHLGLPAALRNLVTGWAERSGLAIELDASGCDDLRLSPEAEANLYRVAQEALHNVVKHAGASRATVLLQRLERDLVLVVEDNGRGFDPAATIAEQARLGLLSMRERAALAGGALEIESRPRGGTAVFVRVPLAQ